MRAVRAHVPTKCRAKTRKLFTVRNTNLLVLWGFLQICPVLTPFSKNEKRVLIECINSPSINMQP